MVRGRTTFGSEKWSARTNFHVTVPLTWVSSIYTATPLRSLVSMSIISWKYPGAELMPNSKHIWSNPSMGTKHQPPLTIRCQHNLVVSISCSPRSNVWEWVPNVFIMESLAACNTKPSCCLTRSAGEGGMTLTSPPVSTRKRVPVTRSTTKNRQLEKNGPGMRVAISIWPWSFPRVSKEACTFEQPHHNGNDTSKG